MHECKERDSFISQYGLNLALAFQNVDEFIKKDFYYDCRVHRSFIVRLQLILHQLISSLCI